MATNVLPDLKGLGVVASGQANTDSPHWTITPIPTQEREARAAARSKRFLAIILNRICWNEFRGVEVLSAATRYFSRYSNAALSFARHSADESRHAAMFAKRAIDIGGVL